MPAQHGDQAARAWRERIGEPSDLDQATTPAGPELTAPGGVRATPGRGQVTLCWDLVPGATGYLIHRAADPDGPFRPLDHGGGDVLAVASPPYADTEPASPGTTWCYAVAAIAGPATVGPLSRAVPGHRALRVQVGNLRKPTFWALRLLNRLGPRQLAVSVTGDGAWSMVEAVAATAPAGRIGVLIWNGTLSQHPVPDPGPLTREITLHLEVAPGDSYTVRHYRIDAGHSNIAAVWAGLAGGRDWPADQEWATLAAANVLAEWEPPGRHHGADGPLRRRFPLPQPGVSYLELAPDRAARAPGPDA